MIRLATTAVQLGLVGSLALVFPIVRAAVREMVVDDSDSPR